MRVSAVSVSVTKTAELASVYIRTEAKLTTEFKPLGKTLVYWVGNSG